MGNVRDDGKDVEGSGHLLIISFALIWRHRRNDHSPWCIAEHVKDFVNDFLSSLI
jgi:hypothetical protein